jgi:hypothetical protein
MESMLRIELALALGNLPTKQEAPDPLSAAHGHGEQPNAPNTTAGLNPLEPYFQNQSQLLARTAARRRALCVRCLPCSGRVRR